MILGVGVTIVSALHSQIRGHHIAQLDPLEINSADLDDSQLPELLYNSYNFGKNIGTRYFFLNFLSSFYYYCTFGWRFFRQLLLPALFLFMFTNIYLFSCKAKSYRKSYTSLDINFYKFSCIPSLESGKLVLHYKDFSLFFFLLVCG